MSKPIYRYDIEQNSDEWLEVKLAKFSASVANDLLMDKSNKGYQNLIARIVEERITGERCENNQFKGNWATERGHQFEPIARRDYEIRKLEVIKLVGVVELNNWVLCSPDGLIGNNILHQIKCPIFSTQKEYLDKIKLNKDPLISAYKIQIQFELFVTSRDYTVLTSYHPYLKAIDIMVKRDLSVINEIENRLGEAKNEVLKQIEIIKNY